MPRRDNDRGRNFYETSSPFETYQGGRKARTYRGLTDNIGQDFKPHGAFQPHLDPEQYDNPRGFPGMALIHKGEEKAKAPFSPARHNINHAMEGEAQLAPTGKRGET